MTSDTINVYNNFVAESPPGIIIIDHSRYWHCKAHSAELGQDMKAEVKKLYEYVIKPKRTIAALSID